MNNKILAFIFFSLLWLQPATASELGSLKGIKWKQELPPRGGQYHGQVYGRLARPLDINGNYLSFDRIATQLKKKGVKAVAFRIDNKSRYVDENGNGKADEMANYHNEIRKMTKILDAKGIDVILFARMWLTNNTNADVFDQFDLYLKTLSDQDRNRIDGIALTEIHLSNLDDVKRRALWIPPKFEAKYPGWLKNRMFLIPGADNGIWFRGVNKDDDFHQKMNDLVGEFAFVVKSMALKDIHDNKNRYTDFLDFIPRSNISVADRENYLKEDMGLQRLIDYQQSAEISYPNIANIVYWGDNGDAMSNVHPKAAQALHNVLNQNGGANNRGTFMYFGVAGESLNEDPDSPNGVKRTISKSIIWYDENTDSHSRQNLEFGVWDGVMGVYDQWNSWFMDQPNYWLQ